MSLRPTLLRFLTTTQKPILRAPIQKPTLLRQFSSSFSTRTRTSTPTPSSITRYTKPFKEYTRPRRFNSTSSSSNKSKPNSNTSKEPTGLSARLRKLTREYGWAALGVYLTLSALDFPFCFAAVRLLGVDRIGHFEHVVLGYLKGVFGPIWPGSSTSSGEADPSATSTTGEEGAENQGILAGIAADSDAEVRTGGLEGKVEEASIWTQLVFAYAIHKSLLIFVRVPLTAAVTPKVVKVLRRWGWDIGKRKPKSS